MPKSKPRITLAGPIGSGLSLNDRERAAIENAYGHRLPPLVWDRVIATTSMFKMLAPAERSVPIKIFFKKLKRLKDVFDLRGWNKELERTTSEIIVKMKNVRDLLKRRERRGDRGRIVMPQSSEFEVKLKEAVDEVRELFENLTKPYNKFLEAQEAFYSAIVKAHNVSSEINSLISEWPGKKKACNVNFE
jgi:hypothetical protein